MGMIGRLPGMLLALAAAAFVSACNDGDAKSDVARPRLEDGRIVFPQGSPQLNSFATEPVAASSPQQLRLTGRIIWDENRTVRLFPAFAGRVIHILVKAGDRVKQGETLAVLASPDFGQAQADARRAQSDFAPAEADYARAEAELARASGKIRLYGGGSESVDQNLALASPIDGVVVERNINPGQELRTDLQLSNSPAMFVVTDPSRLWVQLDATESQLASLKRGQTVTLRSSAWPEEGFAATIETISDFIDPASRTIKVRGSVVNRDRKLKGEMFVTAELPDVQRAGLQLPERALVLSEGRYYVFVEESPGRFAWSEVKIEGVRDGLAGVVSGVNLGQKVVVEGTLLLHRLYRQLAGGAPA